MAAFVAGLGPAAVAASSPIEIAAQPVRWQLSIARLSLNDALMQLAQQVGIQVARLSDVGPTTIMVGPLSGSYTREEALGRLLRGTGLTYQFVNDHTVAIVRQSETGSAVANAQPLPLTPSTPVDASGGTNDVGNNSTQGETNVSGTTDKSNHPNLLSRLLGIFAVCGAASLSPGNACAQDTSASSNGLEEVVVTAERRAVDIQTTSVSETAISGTDLLDKHVDFISDLESQVPGLSVTDNGFTQNINVRGMGNSTASPNVTTGVPVYRDGLYQPEAILLTEPFYDIADVEVLRGPQGTIVGQNSTGGAVVINSANPNFNGVNGYAEVLGGDYSERKLDGAINLPINEVLAARVAFNVEDRHSFFEDIGPQIGDAYAQVDSDPGHIDEKNVRFGLLFKPNDTFQAVFKVEINDLSTGGLTPRPLPPCSICAPSASFYQYGYNGPSIYNNFQTLGPYQLDYNTPELQNDKADRYSLDMRYMLPGDITLRSLTGYQYLYEQRVDDADASAAPAGVGSYWEHTIGPDPYYSEELNLISPDTGRLTWIGGTSYFWRSTPVDLLQYPYGSPPEPSGADANTYVHIGTHVRLFGLFGQVSYQITPALQLQVGGRYSADGQTSSGSITIPGPGIVIPNGASYSKNVPSGKVALNWSPITGQNFYAFWAHGFKDGGINNGLSFFKPEYVNDYEAGWKGDFLNSHLRTQLGAYYMAYDGMQQQVLNGLGGGNTVINLGNSQIEGLEFSAQGRLDNWVGTLGLAVNHSKLGASTAIAAYELPAAVNTNLPQCAPAQTAGCNNYTPYIISLSGESNPYSPKFQANVSLSYIFDLAKDNTLTPRVDYSYTGSQYASIFQNTSFYLLSARSLLDLYLDYGYKNWDVQLFARNVTNQVYIAGVGGATGTAGSSGADAFYGDPRTYGLSIKTRF